jgi:hypothetical protein
MKPHLLIPAEAERPRVEETKLNEKITCDFAKAERLQIRRVDERVNTH